MTPLQQEAIYRAIATKAMMQIARDLRKRETSTEDRLWSALRDRRLAGLKFRRQHPIAGTAYVVDFLCYAAKLIVEVDGSIHAQQADDDQIRQENIEALGYQVIRLGNEEVLRNLQGVLVAILTAVQEVDRDLLGDEALTPSPSPSGRGEPKPHSARLANQATGSQPSDKLSAQNLSEDAQNADSSSARLSGSPRPEGEGLGVRASSPIASATLTNAEQTQSLPTTPTSTGLSGSPLPEGEGLGVRDDTDISQ